MDGRRASTDGRRASIEGRGASTEGRRADADVEDEPRGRWKEDAEGPSRVGVREVDRACDGLIGRKVGDTGGLGVPLRGR